MKAHVIKFILLLVPLFWMSSCSKNDDKVTPSETAFNTDVLNRNFFVESANDNGTDVTGHFTGYVFKYVKNNSTSGAVTANNDLLNFNGTWSVSNDFNNLTITFSDSAPTDFSFVTNTWKITAMTDTYFHLTAANGDNKTLNFAIK